MKMTRTTLLAVAAIAAVACVKEQALDNNTITNPDLVEHTIIAGTEDSETKAAFSEQEYPKIVWQGNEEISVLGANTGNQKFTTTSTGSSAVFTGLADLNDDVLYAVYPYDAAVTLTADGKLSNVTVPAVQTATAGSFDPKAYIAVGKSTDKQNFAFKAIGGFIRFQVEDAANVKSVTVLSNANNNMACTATVTINETNGSVSHGSPYVDGTTSYSVKLQGTFENGKDYFMIVRPQPYTGGVTVYIEYKDGKVLSRKGESALFESGKGRNYIKNLGVLKKADFKEVSDAYSLYTMGYDVTIGNLTINQATHGAATLITNESTNKTLEPNGVYFIDSAAENVTMKNAGKLVVLSADEKMATVTKAGQVAVNATDGEDYFVMQNIKFVTGMTSGNMLGGGKGDLAYETIYFENCKFEVPKNMNFMYAQLPISNFVMIDCDVRLHATTSDKNMLQTKTTSTYASVVFRNNVFYCTDGDTANYKIFNNNNATITSLEFKNNTVASVYPKATVGYVNAKAFTAAEASFNLFYIPNYSTYVVDKYTGILYSSSANTGLTMVTNLAYYEGDALPGKRLKPHYHTNEGTIYNKKTSDGSPFATSDFANGIFTTTDTYKSYGAKR